MFKVVKEYLIWDFFSRFSCWTPGHGQKGPIKEGRSFCLTVHPIICLSSHLVVRFLRIGSFAFSETYYGVRGPYLVICDKKWYQNGQKWPRFFGLFKKINSLVLSSIAVKQNFLWPFNILQKLCTWEKSGSKVIMAKNDSWPMRFQYFLIVNIS